MTERSASERALSALKAIGMQEAPITTLEREDALFVLTGQTLVYQDGGGTRRVTLRDLTRIHSDEQGMLRVETPAGTALTASLLGFDVGGVQGFFAQVRDTTARAKELPASPLPTPGGLKTFGTPVDAAAVADTTPPRQVPTAQAPPVREPERTISPPPALPPRPEPRDVPPPRPAGAQTTAAPATETSAKPAPATPPPGPAPSGPLPDRGAEPPTERASPGLPQSAASLPSAQPAPTVPREAPAAASASANASPGTTPATSLGATAPAPATTPRPAPITPAQPVVISSSAFTPQTARTASLNPAPTALSAVAGAPAATQMDAPTEATPEPVARREPLSVAHALTHQADVVDGLVGRLRFLGGVLFVAALALAYVQFSGGSRLDGLWTLLSGGVGTIALLALAELARLLALIGRAGGATDAG